MKLFCPTNIEELTIEAWFETEQEAIDYCVMQFNDNRDLLYSDLDDWSEVYTIERYTRKELELLPEN